VSLVLGDRFLAAAAELLGDALNVHHSFILEFCERCANDWVVTYAANKDCARALLADDAALALKPDEIGAVR
jgi:hypothetical protein